MVQCDCGDTFKNKRGLKIHQGKAHVKNYDYKSDVTNKKKHETHTQINEEKKSTTSEISTNTQGKQFNTIENVEKDPVTMIANKQASNNTTSSSLNFSLTNNSIVEISKPTTIFNCNHCEFVGKDRLQTIKHISKIHNERCTVQSKMFYHYDDLVEWLTEWKHICFNGIIQ
eukprot:GAHX01004664.1.p1 GENE.GAHX01004664.1~~GAHX01004664.1.p1  ORF type:complete len:171 (+),score=30.68 GAHX01004664.1:45-557(+)